MLQEGEVMIATDKAHDLPEPHVIHMTQGRDSMTGYNTGMRQYDRV